MDSVRENSLRDNPYFEVRGLHNGRMICCVKATGELATLNPQSTSEMLRLAPSAWWIGKGWRVTTRRGKVTIDWLQASLDICAIAESVGYVDKATYNELMRQRSRQRFARLRAYYESELASS